MGDRPIIVITLRGDGDDQQNISEAFQNVANAEVLEVRSSVAIDPSTLQQISKLAVDNNLGLRFRDET